MPSGEAMVRQKLYGQLFFARNFGKLANVEWFPDTFGYASNMPQIFAKAGIEYFMTQKLTSNKETKWPFWAWLWEAPDGTRLFSYLTGNHIKLGPLGGYDVGQMDSDVRESYVKVYRLLKPGEELIADYETDKPEEDPKFTDEEIPFIGCFFGEGDGGHGPQGIEMAFFRAFAERGYVKWKTTAETFAELAKYSDRLPVWKDELYYQFHRGSLTSQVSVKRMNRYYEWVLPQLEGLYGIIDILDPGKLGKESVYRSFYTEPKDQIQTADNAIEQLWQNCCLMAFHDVLPGTSIPEVYDECYEFWFQDMRVILKLRNEGMEKLKRWLLDQWKNDENISKSLTLNEFKPYLVVNTSGSRGVSLVEIPECTIMDSVPIAAFVDNKLVPVQLLPMDDGGFELDLKLPRYAFTAEIGEWTAKIFWLLTVPKQMASSDSDIKEIYKELNIQCLGDGYSVKEMDDKFVLSSPKTKVEIDKASGNVRQINFDGIELLSGPIALKSYYDKSRAEFSWNLMPNWWESPLPDNEQPPAFEIKEQGPIRWTIRISKDFGKNSKSWIDYSFVRDMEGLFVEIGFDFHETETLVKYEIPLSVKSDYTLAEGPYCVDKRRNVPKANHDVARWEKWMHTFLAMEDSVTKYGVAIINEGKYGFDTKMNRIGISVIRGPQYVGSADVAWVRETRKQAEKDGFAKPPTHQDQGMRLTRLCILPYKGLLSDGKIHDAAHRFNTPVMVSEFPTEKSGENTGDVSQIKSELTILSTIGQDPSKLGMKFVNSSPGCIETTVLKHSEDLPSFMDSNSKAGFVIRVVNNSNEAVDGSVSISDKLLANFSKIHEVDLLERKIVDGIEINLQDLMDDKKAIQIAFKPYEIRTFKVF